MLHMKQDETTNSDVLVNLFDPSLTPELQTSNYNLLGAARLKPQAVLLMLLICTMVLP